MSLNNITSDLSKKYSIIDIVNLNEFTKPKTLVERIKKLKKDEYSDNERIVFIYSENKLKFLIDFLKSVDIPNFFVILLTHDATLKCSEFETFFYTDNDVKYNNVVFDMADSHCIYPWIGAQLDEVGNFRPCCNYDRSPNKLENNIQNMPIKDFYTGKTMSTLRNQFRQGEMPAGCHICFDNEHTGAESLRTQSKFKFHDSYYQIDYNEHDIKNIEMLDLKLGIKCNLSCRICAPHSSSKIADIELAAGRLSIENITELVALSNWPESDLFWNQLKDLANNLTYLDIKGGEPLMNKSHFKFLKYLIDNGVSKKIKLNYNTNGTFYSNKFFDYWQHFKEIKLNFSLDNIDERFEYERTGGNWQHVVNNIQKYNSHISDSFKTDIYTTVSILNVYYLPELFEWGAMKFNDSININISNILFDPPPLAISNLSLDIKSKIIEKLKKFKIVHQPVTAIINHMMSTDSIVDVDLVGYLKTRDLERKQNFSESHPEMAKLIGYV
jgi:organic radical activating enzyme